MYNAVLVKVKFMIPEISAKVPEVGSLTPSTALVLSNSFSTFFEQLKEWEAKALSIVVTDELDRKGMEAARQARLTLKKIRVDADKMRKTLKEDSLRYGKAVQGIYNAIEAVITPLESHLERQEKYAEIKHAERQQQLREERGLEIAPYIAFVPVGVDVGIMTEEQFGRLYWTAKTAYEAHEKAKEAEEAARKEKEAAEAQERERLRKENESLKAAQIKEAERRKRLQPFTVLINNAHYERVIKLEDADFELAISELKQKLVEHIAAERAKESARQKELAEAKQKAAEAAELIRLAKAKEEEAQKLSLAPDKDKLRAYYLELTKLRVPELSTDKGKATETELKRMAAEHQKAVLAYLRQNWS